MTQQTIKVFLVDDDPVARSMASFQLQGQNMVLQELGDGQACMAALDAKPDVILLDVEMPGMSGIEVCKAIGERPEIDAEIIFVSAHDDLETRLKAYDAGGADYLVKPYHPEELLKKIAVARRRLEQKRGVSDRAQFAQQAAFTAMSSMGEMGVILYFLRTSFNCPTIEDLGRNLCNALEQYGLQALVELRDGEHVFHFSSQGDCTPLEKSILSHAKGMERIFQFRDRLVVNYPHTTLVVPNLPLEDEDQIGRFRDHLAILAEGVEARYCAMVNEQRLLQQADQVVQLVGQLTASLEQAEARQQEHRIQVLEVVTNQQMQMSSTFVHMGLTEDQEHALVEMNQAGFENISRILDQSLLTAAEVKSLTHKLREVAERRD